MIATLKQTKNKKNKNNKNTRVNFVGTDVGVQFVTTYIQGVSNKTKTFKDRKDQQWKYARKIC